MNRRAAFLACLLALPAAGFAADQYQCVRVTSDSNGTFQQNPVEHVELIVDQDTVLSRVHIGAASSDLVFTDCGDVKADGSKFSQWFAKQCKRMESVDGTPVTVEASLAGAFAGISPVIDAAYAMYPNLLAAGEKLGLGTPARTFIIFADRKPLYEFFCYPQSAEVPQN